MVINLLQYCLIHRNKQSTERYLQALDMRLNFITTIDDYRHSYFTSDVHGVIYMVHTI